MAGVTLASCATTVYLLSLPQDDALLSAVGGVTPLVTYHRGDCSIAPENTIPAFRSAIRKGGDRIELDVQMSRGRRGGRDPRHQPEALHRQKRQGV